MTKARLFLILVTAATILFLLGARLLVLEHPEHADTIVVLAGETYERPERGVQLLQAGYAAKLVLDEPIHQRVFNWTVPELAQRWINTLPQAPRMSVCPISGWSTKQEAHEVAECLQRVNAHNVLLVTSDFHTRRAFSIFTHELSGYHFSIAASHNPTRFGFAWWQHREWAKTTLYEWIRLLWWELVDRWH